MLYFANPCTPEVREAMANGPLACIATPAQGNKLPAGTVWCIDNGCGPTSNGKPGDAYPGDERYLGLLQDFATAEGSDPCDPDTSGFVFAVAPDVLGDAAATLRRSYMLAWIRKTGLPAAFVAQNGLEHILAAMSPDELVEFWGSFDVLFLGGSAECVPCRYVRPWDDRDRQRCPHCTRRLAEWKLGDAARALVAEAKRRGKWVHMGRVNSFKRYAYAASIGCDSADGTFVTKAPDKNLPIVRRWHRDLLRSQATQAGLFDLTPAVAA